MHAPRPRTPIKRSNVVEFAADVAEFGDGVAGMAEFGLNCMALLSYRFASTSGPDLTGIGPCAVGSVPSGADSGPMLVGVE